MSEGLILGEIRQEWRPVPVADVIVRDRQRALNPAHVKAVKESFDTLGGQLQLQPIVLTEDLVLVDGRHRLEAAREAGWEFISATILHGATDEDRVLLEAEANRVRLQLTPLELEEAWTKVYEPAFKARAKNNQRKGIQNLRNGADSPVIVNYNNRGEDTGVSLPQAARTSTGLSLATINKITDIRAHAQSESAPEEVKKAAEQALKKLARPGAPVDSVHKALLQKVERASRHRVDPSELELERVEKQLDKTLSDSSLLAERLAGPLGEDLLKAATATAVARETLRGVRYSLVAALAQIVITECKLEPDQAAALHRIGSDVTRVLSERTVKGLGMEPDHD